ncbi:hypothetical protein, partial [Thioalkalivibrio sp.]|uniref:hypothetical protein n=1 Tax=Thioalkalivibrio sp. TaxID=2093813 RepID=UPI0039757E70
MGEAPGSGGAVWVVGALRFTHPTGACSVWYSPFKKKMKQEFKKELIDLIGKDDREIKKIERARAKRDARFFDDWFDKYNKTGKDF